MERSRLEGVYPVLMSRDVTRSIDFYKRLGFELTFTDNPGEPRYAGVARDGLGLHLQWHDPAEWDYPEDRPTYRFVVDDVDLLHRELVDAGITDMTEPSQTEWGASEFHVWGPDRNGLQCYHGSASSNSASA